MSEHLATARVKRSDGGFFTLLFCSWTVFIQSLVPCQSAEWIKPVSDDMQLNQFVPNISLEERTLKRVRERKGTLL